MLVVSSWFLTSASCSLCCMSPTSCFMCSSRHAACCSQRLTLARSSLIWKHKQVIYQETTYIQHKSMLKWGHVDFETRLAVFTDWISVTKLCHYIPPVGVFPSHDEPLLSVSLILLWALVLLSARHSRVPREPQTYSLHLPCVALTVLYRREIEIVGGGGGLTTTEEMKNG